jgi:murein DD-endopeptidase MepM/ murein hydrolase activator NlpD
MMVAKLILIFLVFISFQVEAVAADPIKLEGKRFKTAYGNFKSEQVVDNWYVPFATKNKKSIKTVAVVSVFGAKRLSYLRGHFHTGTDLVPKPNNKANVNVYPIAGGIVCSIHLGRPHTTVVIKHKLKDGRTIFSSYKHLARVDVTLGQQVSHEDVIGRLYTRNEAKELGGNYDHLHLEIRKKFDDYGVASWLTMKKVDLDTRFIDAYKFLKENMREKE